MITWFRKTKLVPVVDNKEVIAELEKVNKEQISEQLRQLQQSIYHLSARIQENTEQVVALTTAIEVLQHESESMTLFVETINNELDTVQQQQQWFGSTKKDKNNVH